MNEINVKTGLKTFKINFSDRNESAEISFNPNDPDLSIRFSELKDRIGEKLKNVKDIDLNEDGTAKDLSYVEQVKEITDIVKSEIDIAFGNKISDVVFKYCSPMALVDGDYFILQFIKAISPVIKSNIENESRKLDKHLAKYKNK